MLLDQLAERLDVEFRKYDARYARVERVVH